MTMITPSYLGDTIEYSSYASSLVPSSDPLVTAASVLEFALPNQKASALMHDLRRANSADIHHTGGRSSMHLEGPIRPIVSRITIHWPSFYNVVTGKTLALPNLIALQHIPLSPAGVIAKRPAPIALPNSCAAYTYGSLRFTPIKERAVIVCLWMYRVILLTRRGDGW